MEMFAVLMSEEPQCMAVYECLSRISFSSNAKRSPRQCIRRWSSFAFYFCAALVKLFKKPVKARAPAWPQCNRYFNRSLYITRQASCFCLARRSPGPAGAPRSSITNECGFVKMPSEVHGARDARLKTRDVGADRDGEAQHGSQESFLTSSFKAFSFRAPSPSFLVSATSHSKAVSPMRSRALNALNTGRLCLRNAKTQHCDESGSQKRRAYSG